MSAKKVVLSIDDVSLSLTTVKGLLSKYFDVRVAKSGPLALYILGHVKVDLILLDIEMPEMSGFEFVNVIRQIDDLQDIPIIIVTSHADGKTINEAIKIGVKDFIVKPINADALKQKVFKALDMPFPAD